MSTISTSLTDKDVQAAINEDADHGQTATHQHQAKQVLALEVML